MINLLVSDVDELIKKARDFYSKKREVEKKEKIRAPKSAVPQAKKEPKLVLKTKKRGSSPSPKAGSYREKKAEGPSRSGGGQISSSETSSRLSQMKKEGAKLKQASEEKKQAERSAKRLEGAGKYSGAKQLSPEPKKKVSIKDKYAAKRESSKQESIRKPKKEISKPSRSGGGQVPKSETYKMASDIQAGLKKKKADVERKKEQSIQASKEKKIQQKRWEGAGKHSGAAESSTKEKRKYAPEAPKSRSGGAIASDAKEAHKMVSDIQTQLKQKKTAATQAARDKKIHEKRIEGAGKHSGAKQFSTIGDKLSSAKTKLTEATSNLKEKIKGKFKGSPDKPKSSETKPEGTKPVGSKPPTQESQPPPTKSKEQPKQRSGVNVMGAYQTGAGVGQGASHSDPGQGGHQIFSTAAHRAVAAVHGAANAKTAASREASRGQREAQLQRQSASSTVSKGVSGEAIRVIAGIRRFENG
jgi:hypothetical protein